MRSAGLTKTALTKEKKRSFEKLHLSRELQKYRPRIVGKAKQKQ
jgi:hypothetical protein